MIGEAQPDILPSCGVYLNATATMCYDNSLFAILFSSLASMSAKCRRSLIAARLIVLGMPTCTKYQLIYLLTK
jgi:hypothetical protein